MEANFTHINQTVNLSLHHLYMDDFENRISVPLRTFIITTISVLVILSNILNLAVLRITEQIPSISRMFLLNLSCADLMVGLVSCLPCVYPAVHSIWPYGPVWCQVAGITHGVSVTISIWSLALVSVDRYIAILKPLRYHSLMTLSHCRVIICFMWMLAISTFSVPIFTKDNFSYYQFSEEEVICGLYWEYPWFCVVTAVYIPVLSGSVLVFTTVHILRDVVKIRSNQVEPATSGQPARIKSRELKPVKVLGITSIVYFLAWGPYVIEVIILSFVQQLRVPPTVRFATLWLANSNSFMNVIIYSVMYRSFRVNTMWLFLRIYSCVRCQEAPPKPTANNATTTEGSV